MAGARPLDRRASAPYGPRDNGQTVKVATTPSPGLADLVCGREWYHTIELAPGLETPGWFDTRTIVGKLPFPRSMRGMRCLDVGTFDGFWALHMEASGAAEVLCIDLLDPLGWDLPLDSSRELIDILEQRKQGGRGFEIVTDALGSSVIRQECSVYDLSPARVGTFDFVYFGSLLLHLRDPVGALEAVRSVCRGQMLLVDAIDPYLTLLHPRRAVAHFDGLGRPWWWKPNLFGLARLIKSAGFQVVASPRQVYIPAGAGQPKRRLDPRLLRTTDGRDQLIRWVKGDPHAAILAVPSTVVNPELLDAGIRRRRG